MTDTKTDLTREQLEELERMLRHWPPLALLCSSDEGGVYVDDVLALIDMAKRTEAAERERDALREAITNLALCSLTYRDYSGDDYNHCVVCDARLEIGEPHSENCELEKVLALAQPTDAGGA